MVRRMLISLGREWMNMRELLQRVRKYKFQREVTELKMTVTELKKYTGRFQEQIRWSGKKKKKGSIIWRGQWNLPKQSSKKKKEVLQREDSLTDLWDKIKQNNCIIGISERENIEKGTKKFTWRNNGWKFSYPGSRHPDPRSPESSQ